MPSALIRQTTLRDALPADAGSAFIWAGELCIFWRSILIQSLDLLLRSNLDLNSIPLVACYVITLMTLEKVLNLNVPVEFRIERL